MKDISEYTNELYKRIDEKTEALEKRPLFKLRGKDNDSSKKEVGVMSVRRKSLIIVTIVLIGAIVLGATFVVSGRMSIKDPNPERASDPDRMWIGDNEAPNNYDFVKENMQDVTYRIDGVNIVFSYIKSTSSEFDKEYCIDDMKPLVLDYYDSAEGFTIVKYENTDKINGFYTNDYSPVRGDENTKFVNAGGIKGRALEIIANSDTDMEGIENAKVVWEDQITDYSVRMTCKGGSVYMYIKTNGELQSFTLVRSSNASEERKEAAREKVRARIKELEEEKPDSNYVLEEEEFMILGDESYAMFTVVGYQNDNTNASYAIPSDAISYFCIV